MVYLRSGNGCGIAKEAGTKKAVVLMSDEGRCPLCDVKQSRKRMVHGKQDNACRIIGSRNQQNVYSARRTVNSAILSTFHTLHQQLLEHSPTLGLWKLAIGSPRLPSTTGMPRRDLVRIVLVGDGELPALVGNLASCLRCSR